MRLDRRFRLALYAAFSALLATGAGWLWADALKDSDNGELWQAAAANLLMLHGGTAMLALVLLGALLPLHVQRAWRTRRNRLTGIAMVTLNAALILSAFGLYYVGADRLRAWTSDLHIGVGLSLPALFLAHVWLGRRSSRTKSQKP